MSEMIRSKGNLHWESIWRMVETVMVTQDNCGILKVGFPFPDTSLSGFLLQAVSEFVCICVGLWIFVYKCVSVCFCV